MSIIKLPITWKFIKKPISERTLPNHRCMGEWSVRSSKKSLTIEGHRCDANKCVINFVYSFRVINWLASIFRKTSWTLLSPAYFAIIWNKSNCTKKRYLLAFHILFWNAMSMNRNRMWKRDSDTSELNLALVYNHTYI